MTEPKRYSRQVTVNLPVSTQEQLEYIAKETGKSRSSIICDAVDVLYENFVRTYGRES